MSHAYPPRGQDTSLSGSCAVRRKVWDKTHFLVLKLPVNFNQPGLLAELGGVDLLHSETLGKPGKALLLVFDCTAHPLPSFERSGRDEAGSGSGGGTGAVTGSGVGVGSVSVIASKKRAREDD